MSADTKKFNLRSFTSFSLVISTIIMSWSGFILYIAPPGRIANWGTWKLMLFTKAEWQALHTIFSYLFFILVIIHLFFVNWKAFLTYFRSKIKSGLNRKWELVAALIVSIVFFIGTLREWTPFGPVMTFGEKAKESWESDFKVPPVIHMEIYTLQQLSPLLDSVPPERLLKTLRENNIKVSATDISLKDIAADNNTTPSSLYDLLKARHSGGESLNKPEVPQGAGRYTVLMAAKSSGKEVSVLLEKLKTKGVDANQETSMKTIADKLGITPREVYLMLTEE
ncbi:MAG: DUF4405 domain-containing protein [Bacteroidetes bacterium]|nr:DUF4405 domain-containing protein [Bacteroidota bacterium]